MKAIAATMSHDGVIEAGEIELLRAIADSLDCPMPPVIPPTDMTASSYSRSSAIA